ncbi:hypothetical protein PZC41_14175 [Staphylococcus aureus]|uniref:hypothetical protein n=1 Tax=Staphylococcus aureus TaxID=1280 RepID=UPI0023B0F339|nr:hypothetical protein [Staphylococcus aureus]MDE8535451.1 hypothetical protein [Staphylococcus aureus]
MALWNWNPITRLYRLTREGARKLGGRIGQILGQSKMVDVRDDIVAGSQERMVAIVNAYMDKQIGIDDMVKQLRKESLNTSIQQWLLASGGRNQLTRSETGKINAHMRDEYGRIQAFATKVQAGELTPGQARLRAEGFAKGTRQLFERAGAEAMGATLPVYPVKDTQCRGNCGCSWKWKDAGDRWEVVWELRSGAKHCPDCLRYASEYSAANPFIVQKPPLMRQI